MITIKKNRDLTNLENTTADILVKYKVIADDNYNIITSWDGSRIIYEKGREETIIEIIGGKKLICVRYLKFIYIYVGA